MQGSIPNRACRPKRSEFSVVFFETHVNTGSDIYKTPHRGHTPIVTGPISGQFDLGLHLTVISNRQYEKNYSYIFYIGEHIS